MLVARQTSSRRNADQTAIQHGQVNTQLLGWRPVIPSLDRLEHLQQAKGDQRYLCQGELLSDADTRAGVERDVLVPSWEIAGVNKQN